ncbi:MAG: hypothetical protein Q9163_003694, partial [Psora crenata]
MSDTSTLVATEEALSSSRLKGTTLGSISSPRRSSTFSKAYKEASNFFLTRRFSEALSTLQPLLAVGQYDNPHDENIEEIRHAPIAEAERKWRVKIWSLYLTLLNAVADLGPEEGQTVFGRQRWKSLVTTAEAGSIWEEVVNIGYGGVEARVDAEIIVNLANLLLVQSSNQKINQQHLETYLSAAGPAELGLDSQVRPHSTLDGQSNSAAHHINGTIGPRDFEIRVQIIEIYVLHVLPRNGEREYAKEFVTMCEWLDEERKEAFLQALSELAAEDTESHDEYEDALPLHKQAPMEALKSSDITRTDSNVTIKPDPPSMHRLVNRENDFGIEETQLAPKAPMLQPLPPDHFPEPTSRPVRKPLGDLPSRSSKPAASKSSKVVSRPNVLKRSMAILGALQKTIANMTSHMSQNPMVLLRFVCFLMGLVIAFSRRDVRNRVGRLTGAGWERIKKTIGMGVK